MYNYIPKNHMILRIYSFQRFIPQNPVFFLDAKYLQSRSQWETKFSFLEQVLDSNKSQNYSLM
jgi:hypothetical protein